MISSGSDDSNNDTPVTADGSCGPKNGGTVCGVFPAGGVSPVVDVLAPTRRLACRLYYIKKFSDLSSLMVLLILGLLR